MGSATQKPSLKFTDEQAAEFIGKRVLVGITHRSLEDEVVSFEQFHGTVLRVNLREGLVLKINGSDKERSIPPDLNRLERAPPGEYRLRSTGEVVADPDYTVMWTLYPKGFQPNE